MPKAPAHLHLVFAREASFAVVTPQRESTATLTDAG